jgi:hypothetical protein
MDDTKAFMATNTHLCETPCFTTYRKRGTRKLAEPALELDVAEGGRTVASPFAAARISSDFDCNDLFAESSASRTRSERDDGWDLGRKAGASDS